MCVWGGVSLNITWNKSQDMWVRQQDTVRSVVSWGARKRRNAVFSLTGISDNVASTRLGVGGSNALSLLPSLA